MASGLSAGALLGGLAAMWVKARRPIADGMLATALIALPLLALAAGLPLAVIALSAVLGMPGGIYLNTNWATTVQQLVPADVIARFRSYDYLLAFTAIPVGYAIAGPAASAIGADTTLIIAAGVIVASAVVPAVLPAVRVVTRHSDGTITGPPAPEGPGSR